uniref:RING-type E3 ubiquitin transferase n=3 Tax=Setaria italica TaxID=4555 RepID=K3Y188_SETIT
MAAATCAVVRQETPASFSTTHVMHNGGTTIMASFSGMVMACIVLVPLGLFAGSMLYFIGFRWGLSILVVVSVLFYLHWPLTILVDHIGDDNVASGMSLLVQQPAAGTSSAHATVAVPAYLYEKKAGGDECAICLGELQRGEVVKQLPACTHLFHEGCIDVWLRSNVTCPACRSPVDAAPPVAAQILLRTE